ncbi:MAG: amidohydrolase [Rhizobiaceae bacterium]|nr:amidohydrolase [Rhizobiaceae bacterium]
MNIPAQIGALKADMTAWRRHLHARPELGFEELETAHFVAEKLRGFGMEVYENIGRTGVVGTLKGRHGGGPSIGLRADMDALPMTEARALPHASRVQGRMHACGHDGHMATLLGAAAVLSLDRAFAGTLHFIFQPAEEGRGGALAMLEDGLFERFPCDEIYAYHNSERPFGQVVIYDDVVAAAADRFTITIHGRGGHAATPHLAVDPLPIAARILLAIEALPGRLTNVASPAVVTVGSLHAGEAFNTIPDKATLVGTVRCFDDEIRSQLEATIRRVAESEASMCGARADIAYETLFAATVNTAAHAGFVENAASEIVGAGAIVRNPAPELGSEDFSFMLQRRPGCYFLIGQGDPDHQAVAHDVNYDFNDGILPIAAGIFVRLVEQRLGRNR